MQKIKSKYWFLKALVILGLPFLILNLYINVWQFIQEIINGNFNSLLKDFGVYTRTVDFFLVDPSKIYWVPEWIGPNWFIYPPLSIFIFLPFGIIPEPWNLILWRLLNITLYWYSVNLIINIFIDKYKIQLNKKNRIYLYIISFAFGSFYLNINHGQVNILILFFSVLTLQYLLRDKTLLSGFFYVIGFWIKLYPALIFPIFLKNKRSFIFFITSVFLFIFLIPLILSPLIPLDVYKYYFFDLTPYLVNTPLDMSPCNQSLMSFIMHFSLPVETFGQYPLFTVPTWIRIINTISLIFSFTTISFLYLRDKEHYILWTFSSLLLIAPIFSITGWESVYILAMPMILHTLLMIKNEKNTTIIVFIILITLMYLPKPPSKLIAKYTESIPFIFQMLFFFRYMLVSIILIIFNYIKLKNK